MDTALFTGLSGLRLHQNYIDIIGNNMKSRRDALIVAAALAVGLGIQAAPPNAFDVVPQALRILVTDGIVMGIMLAMLLNIILPGDET